MDEEEFQQTNKDIERLASLKEWFSEAGAHPDFPIPEDGNDEHWVDFLFRVIRVFHDRNREACCGWCGWKIVKDESWELALADHLLNCKKHPMYYTSEINDCYDQMVRVATKALARIAEAVRIDDLELARKEANRSLDKLHEQINKLKEQQEQNRKEE